MAIRSPIIVTVGHSDHGKTTLLDKIRGTTVTRMEPGELTQSVGASYVPQHVIESMCKNLLEKFKIKLEVPGLLFIDTPGHKAFLGMRKRGGSVSDLAILVVDVTKGFEEQTDESLTVLKEFKTPFVVAATKIDRIPGWHPHADTGFLDSFEKQRDDVKDELEKKVYMLVSQLAERGFNSERFDRVENFTKQIVIVPVSSKTGEGVPEILTVLSGMSQQFLKEKLEVSDVCRGSVLEVKDVVGLGKTIDVILYDGTIRKGDYLVVWGREPLVTKIKALLIPRPLQELRVEKQFENVDEAHAAVGIKISAPDLEKVIAGSPVVAVRSESEIEDAKKIVQQEVEEVEFEKNIDGVTLKADTLGSLEAMIKILTEENVPIRKADIGHVTRQDVLEAQNVKDSLRRVVLAFNADVLEDAENASKDLKTKIFQNQIIYRLVDDYKQWCVKEREREMQEKLGSVSRPAKVRVLRGFIFRVSNPCIVGVEVLGGVLNSGTQLKKDKKIIGKVKEVQKENHNVKEAKKGDKVAISMDDPVAGRTFVEGDTLYSALSSDDVRILKEVWDKLSSDEQEVFREIQGQ